MTVDLGALSLVRRRPPHVTRFVADVHFGKVAKVSAADWGRHDPTSADYAALAELDNSENGFSRRAPPASNAAACGRCPTAQLIRVDEVVYRVHRNRPRLFGLEA